MARALDYKEGVSRCLGPLREAQHLIEQQLVAQQPAPGVFTEWTDRTPPSHPPTRGP
jgi:hypothetical protein